MQIPYNSKNMRLYLTRGHAINAGVNKDGRVFITEGAFILDDESLTFILAHELSHVKLDHYGNRVNASYATSGAMLVLNQIIPGVGYLGFLVNKAVVNNFSKAQEYDADKMASETCQRCFNISVEKQVHILKNLKALTVDAGGFWDAHPAWEDRIKNISESSQ